MEYSSVDKPGRMLFRIDNVTEANVFDAAVFWIKPCGSGGVE